MITIVLDPVLESYLEQYSFTAPRTDWSAVAAHASSELQLFSSGKSAVVYCPYKLIDATRELLRTQHSALTLVDVRALHEAPTGVIDGILSGGLRGNGPVAPLFGTRAP